MTPYLLIFVLSASVNGHPAPVRPVIQEFASEKTCKENLEHMKRVLREQILDIWCARK